MTQQNPRPAPFVVTDSAFARLSAIMLSEGQDGQHLRVSVEGGGCSGFQYKFDLEDTREADDVVVERDGVKVVVDGMSLMYMIGATLDFKEDLTGSYFRVDNPMAQAQCGCGSSFSI